MGETMKSYCFALAALAVIGLASAAFAGETHTGKAAGPVAMSDSQLDKVTAGEGSITVACGIGKCVDAIITQQIIGADKKIEIRTGSGPQ